jgi:CO/xanthine dehydrogenase Mo-binding subunit
LTGGRARGAGELGAAGLAATIANAMHMPPPNRTRDLPSSCDQPASGLAVIGGTPGAAGAAH